MKLHKEIWLNGSQRQMHKNIWLVNTRCVTALISNNFLKIKFLH